VKRPENGKQNKKRHKKDTGKTHFGKVPVTKVKRPRRRDLYEKPGRVTSGEGDQKGEEEGP